MAESKEQYSKCNNNNNNKNVGGDHHQEDKRTRVWRDDELELLFRGLTSWRMSSKVGLVVEVNKEAVECWSRLGEFFLQTEHNLQFVKCLVPGVQEAVGVIGVTRRMTLEEKGRKKFKLEVSHKDVCLAAMKALAQLLVPLNKDLEDFGSSGGGGGGGPHSESEVEDRWQFYKKQFFGEWTKFQNAVMRGLFEVEPVVGCAMLDVIGEIGRELLANIKEEDVRRLLVFLMGNSEGDVSPMLKSKCGRCLGKIIEFPFIREDFNFVLDLFDVITRNLVDGENPIKTSFAWTFGNWSDALPDIYAHFHQSQAAEPGLDKDQRFTIQLLKTAMMSASVPAKGRYNFCRVSGNIYKAMRLETVACAEVRVSLGKITQTLIQMIGKGLDYKLRWNAAHAVGHALETPVFYQARMESEIHEPILKTLAKWTAQSQNYKERTGCVASLMKVSSRAGYGAQYSLIWEKLVLSISRLPVEESDNIDKFKIEVLLLMFHLIDMIQPEDLNGLYSSIGGNTEILALLVSECLSEIPLERLNEAARSRDHLRALLEKTSGSPNVKIVESLIQAVGGGGSGIFEDADDFETTL